MIFNPKTINITVKKSELDVEINKHLLNGYRVKRRTYRYALLKKIDYGSVVVHFILFDFVQCLLLYTQDSNPYLIHISGRFFLEILVMLL